MNLYLMLYLLLPLVIASDINQKSGQSTRDANKPQRRNQRKLKITTTTATSTETTDHSVPPEFIPREIFKFELADAKIPDFHPQYQQQQKQGQQTQRSQQTPRQRQRKLKKQVDLTASQPQSKETISKEQQSTASDQSGADSRVLQIKHPLPTTSFEPQRELRQRSVKELPFSVQKAINHALKQDFNIPNLDTIKYYFKDSAPKVTTAKLASPSSIPNGAKLFSDSRIKQWWQLPPYVKSTSPTSYPIGSQKLPKITPTTPKASFASTVSPLLTNEYVAYPLLRAYPVQYSMNVASDLINGLGFLYGDRVYAKVPHYFRKNVSPVNAEIAKPLSDLKFNENDAMNGIYQTTPSSISSTAPIVFPSAPTEAPKTQSFVKYYSAELPTDAVSDHRTSLSNDKETINLIHRAVNTLKKQNPHLDVIPKRIENEELIVHVTPKPEYSKKKSTINGLKDIVTEKNLVYLNKFVDTAIKTVNQPVLKTQANKEVINHAYLTHIQTPGNIDDLYESGYAFGYRVRDYHTGNDFGHTQKRMVDGTTHGEYKILMPDGRTQNVKYKADDNGYQADVSYDV